VLPHGRFKCRLHILAENITRQVRFHTTSQIWVFQAAIGRLVAQNVSTMYLTLKQSTIVF